MSAKTKLIFYIGLLFLVIIMSISLVGFTNFKSASIQNYSSNLQEKSFLISKAVEQRVNQYFLALDVVAEQLAITSSGKIDEQSVTGSMKLLNKSLEVLNAYVALENGLTYSSVNNGIVKNFNAKELKREWYTQIFAGEKKFITKPYVSNEGNLVMAMSVPVIRDNQIVAALNVNLAVDTITQFIKQLTLANQVYATRSDGFILASKSSEDIGKNLFDINPSIKLKNGQNMGSSEFILNGENHLAFSSEIKSLGWKIWAWDSDENINTASNDNLIYTSLIAISLLVVSLIIVYYFVIKLMYIPIGGEPTEIAQLIKRISQGDLASTPSKSSDDTGVYAEILDMSQSLNTIVTSINSLASQLDSSSGEMSNSAQSVNESSLEQMLKLEQTATAMNEMTITVEEVAKNAVQASSAANQAFENSNVGTTVVDDMNENINVLIKSIDSVVAVTNKVESSTISIGSILEVINSVSEQTNLLALNAAIEAARAGDQGRGFAVVADEVRNLATKTKQSTNEIQEMINQLQQEAKHSVELMQVIVSDANSTKDKAATANETLEAIKSSVSVIQDMNTQIATAAEEQTHVSNEINISVVTINDLAKLTHEGSDNNKEIAGKLYNVAQSLKQTVVVFDV